MQCPNCSTDKCTKLSLVYLNGVSDVRTTARGRGFDFGAMAGAFSFRSRGRGRFQTQLSKMAGPPLKLRYRHLILCWGLGLGIMHWLFGYLVWLRELSDVRSVALFTQYAHALAGIALFVLASFWWYNHRVRPERLRRWERSFMCDRCGQIFQSFEQKEAA